MGRKSKIGNAICLFACVCLMVFSTCNFAKASVKPEILEYRNGLISIKGDGLSLLPLLQKISESTGIQIVVFCPLSPRAVSVDMVDKPVEQAFRSILRGYSYAAIYSDASAGGVNIITARGGREINPNVRNSNDQNLLTNPSATSRKEKEESSTGQAQLFVPEWKEGAGNVDRRTSREQTSAALDHGAIDQRAMIQKEIKKEQGEPKAGTGKPDTEQTGVAQEQTEAIRQIRAAGATREERIRYQIEKLERRIESGRSDWDYGIWSGIKGPMYVEHDQVRLERYRELLDKAIREG